MMKNSFTHKRLKLKLENLIKDKKIKYKKKVQRRYISFYWPDHWRNCCFRKKIKVIHICFNEKFDSYSTRLWPNLKVQRISKNSFIYSLKKKYIFKICK